MAILDRPAAYGWENGLLNKLSLPPFNYMRARYYQIVLEGAAEFPPISPLSDFFVVEEWW